MMNELHKAVADKNCKFVPGAKNLDGDVENKPSGKEPSDSDMYGLPGFTQKQGGYSLTFAPEGERATMVRIATCRQSFHQLNPLSIFLHHPFARAWRQQINRRSIASLKQAPLTFECAAITSASAINP